MTDREIERLRAENELYRAAIELTGQMLWRAEPDGTLSWASPRSASLSGFDPANGPMEAFLSIVHPDDLERVMERWGRSVAALEPHKVELRMRMKDGDFRLFEVRGAPRVEPNGTVLYWYGTAEDIHERRQIELARSAAEDRYRLALRATSDLLWDLDIASGTIEWGEAAADLFRLDAPLGKTDLGWWQQRLHPEDRDRVTAGFADAIARGLSRWSDTYRFRRNDGSYADIFDRAFVSFGSDSKPLRAVGAMADQSERNQAEAEIRRIEAELAQMARLSAMGTMASMLAHEINQPLTVVANYMRGVRTMLADADGFDRDVVAGAVERAEAGAIRAGQIVRRLRELFSSGSISTTREDVGQLIEEAGALGFPAEHLLGLTLQVEIDPEVRQVECDRIQIQQVLINLIRNAIEAMEGSTRRELLIRARPAPGDMVELSVADTGSGLPEQDIFAQFMTTKRGGMGLGLPLSRTIVEAHGGRIWAVDREGGGACICFTLPRGK